MHHSTRFLLAISLCTLLACQGKKDLNKKSDGPPPPAAVDVIIASPQSASSSIWLNGTVIANEQVVLHAEVSGKLTQLNLMDGATVTKGTMLARVNDADLQAQKKKIESQFELAQKTEKRLRQLLQIQGINQSEYDAALNQLNSTEADLALIQAQIEKTKLVAPFNGKIGLRMVSPGAYITPATELATLVDVGPAKLDFVVPQEYVSLTQTGKTIQVSSADETLRTTARIIALESAINSNTGNLKVRAQLSDRTFMPGNFVKVELPIADNEKKFLVPTSAIIPEADSKKLVLVKNGKAQFVSVKTGMRTPEAVEIKEGIQPGDTIVVSGLLFVKPDAKLKIRSVKSNP
jgi:membrane fusion protein (multidrug efflux system)